MNRSSRSVLLLAVLACSAAAALRCSAGVDASEFEVYPYATTARGMFELETQNAVVSKGHTDGGEGLSEGIFPSEKQWFNSYEFTYGLTDRIEGAIEMHMAQPNGEGLKWAGDNIRLRGRLFDEGILPVDVGWYAELEFHKTPQFDDASRELELRPIIEKDLGPVSLMFNPTFEKVLAGAGRGQGFEFSYAAGVQYRLFRRLSPGLEFYGGTGLVDQPDPASDQQHYVFPTIWGELPGGIEYNFGVGYGLTRGADRLIFKLNIELERWVGAILRPSPEKAWGY